jgi:hypothetical protein
VVQSCSRKLTMQRQRDSRVCRTTSAYKACTYKIKLGPDGPHALAGPSARGLERSNAIAMLWELGSFENTAKPVPFRVLSVME